MGKTYCKACPKSGHHLSIDLLSTTVLHPE